MSRQSALVVCLALAALAAAARGVLFMAPGVRFDADQAIVGLMAKHISEGRAFPLFFYGQSYLLALEAYLAAPVMWLLGPTEVALKLPVLLMNVATAVLLVWRAHRDLGLPPWLALIGALPVVVPPLVPGTRLMEAMGGNIEPLLYALVLWSLRSRTWLFGLALAASLAHREMTAFAAVALVLLEVAYRGRPSRAVFERWAVAAVLVVTVSAAVAALRPFGAMFGPGSVARPAQLDITSGEAVAAQFCITPSRWPERTALLVTDHLPLMVGGAPGAVSAIGVSSGMGHGNPGLGAWVLALTLAGAGYGVLHARRQRASAAPPGEAAVPPSALGWYLILVGVISTAVYVLVACSQITLNSLRYNLLFALVPAGAVLTGLRTPVASVRAGLVTATLVWTGLSLDDYRALAGEVRSGRWPDRRGEAIAALEARNLRVLWGEFRLAYVVSFRSAERVIVAATTIHRIDEYARRAAATGGPVLRQDECAGGEVLVPGYWLCPPAPGERPPVY